MDFLADIAKTLRLLSEGASFEELRQAAPFQHLVILAACLIPPTVIAFGIGMTNWRETPLAQWMGFSPEEPPPDDWAARARDLDKDGLEDF